MYWKSEWEILVLFYVNLCSVSSGLVINKISLAAVLSVVFLSQPLLALYSSIDLDVYVIIFLYHLPGNLQQILPSSFNGLFLFTITSPRR